MKVRGGFIKKSNQIRQELQIITVTTRVLMFFAAGSLVDGVWCMHVMDGMYNDLLTTPK